jgi:acyl-CoA thioesterase FadM
VTELRRLYECTVAKEEIDHLGHMNVRFYGTKARAATRALAAGYGLTADACRERGVALCVPDSFTRHYREQLAGSRLAVMSGVLSVTETELRLHHELVNQDNGEIAATFVHGVRLQDCATREFLSFPAGLAESAQASVVAWPEYARPRTVNLDRIPSELSLATAMERGLEIRKPRLLRADECEPDGFFAASRIQELFWGGEPIGGRAHVPLHETDDGRTFGWATMESRLTLFEAPRFGARVQSFSAEVHIARKTSFRHHWVFDLDCARLLCVSSSVNLAFDIEARRSIEIPAAIRSGLESQYHPDLL